MSRDLREPLLPLSRSRFPRGRRVLQGHRQTAGAVQAPDSESSPALDERMRTKYSVASLRKPCFTQHVRKGGGGRDVYASNKYAEKNARHGHRQAHVRRAGGRSGWIGRKVLAATASHTSARD
ncbi:hypothetical protein Trydic_g9793 [Trypoxylus dichotomus]